SSQGMLVAARAAQGLGGAIISPASLAIITTTFTDGADRNKALGAWGAMGGAGGAFGVLLGGVLTDLAGWQWILFINVPIGLAAAAIEAGLAFLPMTLTIIVGSTIVSRLTARRGAKPLLVIGMSLQAIGLLLFAGVSADGSYMADVLVPSLITAAGMGIAFVPVTIAA